MKKDKVFFRAVFILILFFSLINTSRAQETSPPLVIQHNPIQQFNYGDILNITVIISQEAEWAKFYFKLKSVPQFQVRYMEKQDSTFSYALDTSTLPQIEFDYYLEAKIGENILRYPPEAPTETISVAGTRTEATPEVPQQFPSPEEEEKRFQFPISANLSLETVIAEKAASTGEKTTVSGNIRLFQNVSLSRSSRLEFDSNFNYTSVPLAEEKKIDLSNLTTIITSKAHTLKIGDISINESEYSIAGLGRRGVEYLFDNRKIYFHFFDVNSQQPKGFKGFGIPKSYLSLMGGALGLNLLREAISFKAIYVAGKDDPNRGINTGSSIYSQSRKGKVVALLEETRLFNNMLNLKGEYARSSYDGDLTDMLPQQKDKAYNIGGQLQYKFFSLSARYSYTGKNFNSIGYQFMTSDRKSLSLSTSFSIAKLNISGSISSQSDNVEKDISQPTTKNLNGNLNLGWNLTSRVMINLGYRRDDQSTYQKELEITGQDSLTNEFSGSLTWTLSAATSLNFSLTNSNLSSQSSPETDSSALNLNFGAAIRVGNFFSLNPTAGYSSSKNKFSGQTSNTYNLGASGDLTIWPRYISLNLSCFYNYSQMAMGSNKMFNAASSLNFSLGNILKKINIVLSLKGTYSSNKSSESSSEDYRILLQGSLSF